MSSQGDPRDPSRPDGGLSEISAAAERARRRLHEEIGQLRAGIEEMLVQQSAKDGRPRGGAAPKIARGASFGLVGLMGAIALAIPATIAVREGFPLVEGGAIPGPPPEPRSAQGVSIAGRGTALEAAFPGGVGAAGALPGGSTPHGGGSGSELVVREAAPVDSGGSPPAAPEAPGSGPIAQAPTQPAPTQGPEGAPPASAPQGGGAGESPQPEAGRDGDGAGQEGGPVSAQAPQEDEGGGPGQHHGPPHPAPPHPAPPHPVPANPGPPHPIPPQAPPPWADAHSAGHGSPASNGHGQGAGHGRGGGAGRSGR